MNKLRIIVSDDVSSDRLPKVSYDIEKSFSVSAFEGLSVITIGTPGSINYPVAINSLIGMDIALVDTVIVSSSDGTKFTLSINGDVVSLSEIVLSGLDPLTSLSLVSAASKIDVVIIPKIQTGN